jgi:hypothetical protein
MGVRCYHDMVKEEPFDAPNTIEAFDRLKFGLTVRHLEYGLHRCVLIFYQAQRRYLQTDPDLRSGSVYRSSQ